MGRDGIKACIVKAFVGGFFLLTVSLPLLSEAICFLKGVLGKHLLGACGKICLSGGFEWAEHNKAGSSLHSFVLYPSFSRTY